MAAMEAETASDRAADDDASEQGFQEREGDVQELVFHESERHNDLTARWRVQEQEFERVYQELESVRAQQKQRSLDPDARRMIYDIATETINEFVVRRPCSLDEVIYVDVHFEPGFERTSMSLRVGGEGAGSADAKFKVRLDDDVSSLAKQAAKYWGLDHTKVFFLDRDGRIVPDTMRLGDVVLPARAASSSSAHLHGGASGGASSSDALARPGSDEVREVFQVKERNYSLTLVRAGTVLQKEDLIRPGGERWNDFTFDQHELQKDLETTRKKQGEGAVQEGVALTSIPNLYDLIEDGKRQKRRKRKDRIFRVVEFVLFIFGLLLYYILLEPNDRDVHVRYLISRGLDRDLQYFQNNESDLHGLSHFEDVRTEHDFRMWLEGPLRRTLLTDLLSSRNLFILAAGGLIYPDPTYVVDTNINFCSTEGVIGSCLPDDPTPAPTPAENMTATSTTVTTTVTTTETTFIGTASNTAAPTEAPVSPTGCTPKVLESCPNSRVIAVYEDALKKCDTVPECRPTELLTSLEFLGRRWVESVFNSISGLVRLHKDPTRVPLDFTNETTFSSSVQDFLHGGPDFTAKLVLLAVYSPTQDAFFVINILVERTAGSLVPSFRRESIGMGNSGPGKFTLFGVIFVLTIACFILEVRRITSCPGAWRVEEERERVSCWTCCFCILPLLILGGLCVIVYKATWRSATVVNFEGETGIQLDETSFDDIYALMAIHAWEELLTVAILIVFNTLFFRYLLMYFPELLFITTQVRKMSSPMLYTLLLILVCMAAFWLILYTTYSQSFMDFRNHVVAAIQTIRFVQGNFEDWWRMYEFAPTMFSFLIVCGFLTMTLMVNNLAVAITVSHEKEKDLYENSQYHPAWQSEKRSDEFNPALVGWKFREGKDPVRPEPHQH